MEKSVDDDKPCELGDQNVKDVTVCLRNPTGSSEQFFYNSSFLQEKSKFFADKLSHSNSAHFIEIHCSHFDYDHHLDLLNLLHLPGDSVLDSWKSVKSALGILQVAVSLQCEELAKNCVQYLEATPWEENEEEEIIRIVPKLGSLAAPILARALPVDLNTTKNVLIAAIHFATSVSGPCPPFGEELKISAQEQVEYMLGEDEETLSLTSDDEVKSEVKRGLSKAFSLFQNAISSLRLEPDLMPGTLENRVLRSLSDLEWLCHVLPKINLMRDFVFSWAEISDNILCVMEDDKFDSSLLGLKLRLIEVTAKVLEAVGYGNVILPALLRVQLLKTWLPYIRKMKPLLDSMCDEKTGSSHKMDEELCQNIEGAVVSLILALPSNDQAEILADWMENEWLRFPDLSEAFEIWCYRTKSAKRRLVEDLERFGGNNSVGSDLSV
ncbi:hypothetical protein Nepgr_028577 [Nepenthes gracilis]|uniref:BTB/POZ domain-containing protein n=1 Tax=Nepenthes gracilis TaxID=150966 RepID=A0AAD3TD51_NEPGR|nr:hypothetical protein Nepgr_028577 [Nepenthes gracilis]